MASLFESVDSVLCRFLRIDKRADLNHKTRVLTISAHGAAAMIKEVYNTLESNYRKAVVLLAQNKHMDGWFNQCPVASGIVDPVVDKKRAVDLVHVSNGAAHPRATRGSCPIVGEAARVRDDLVVGRI